MYPFLFSYYHIISLGGAVDNFIEIKREKGLT
nr:MAG TPA: hypothetical protein [Caudoviricetes sp.]DAP10734.1 MAG TPA: hypothetical protein [Caudoviricetes sp.]DAS36846.1 MAG TPA: hypothetical protein [Caudoviricetes sp.]